MRILKNKSEILKNLIKQKKAKISLDEFINDIIKKFAKQCVKDIKESFSELIVFAYENYGIDKESFINLINSKLQNIGIKDFHFDKESLILASRDEIGLKSSAKIGFDILDQKAINLIDNSFYWLKNEYNEHMQERIKNAVKDVMSGNLARKDLAKRLQEEFSGMNVSQSYFEGVADNIINQNRNLIAIIDRNESVEYFQVIARMDDKTSEICRSMHMRIIPAKHLINQAKNLLNATSMADKKAAAIWQNKAYNGTSAKMPSNFGLPPYHFHCRTRIIPVYPKEYEQGGVKFKATSSLSENEIIKHIDKIGVERVWKKSNTHIKDKHQIQPIQVIKALNSITKIAPNKEKSLYTNAISANGYFMVFDGEKLVTIYKPTRNLNEYFKDNSFLQEQIIIKRWW